ncbi:glycosyltransferase involved in cell wall biosynthesis [Flavobacterium arsenatis]|uniref:Glycosyltransferase involved in cell wall biosynthesis n=1 Tax=Flavobacterium arsenatis TaxID=1484332 RepID=A0ABU1TM07_9FLAO|nr:glycosyltransferase [Flavobacterium arsenatis]MDR6967004.1 glycosyltransferase involved in cell wall biosynthesis [Flavobacterium arsenatis]
MKRKKLLIISHTEHYRNQDQEIVGWGPTINEVNYLADFWEEVVHIGCMKEGVAPKSALPYSSKNINYVPIPPYGGKTLLSKVLIFTKIPKIISQVVRNLDGATEVQLRLPTSMGLFLLPLFSFFLPRKYTLWVKYAGNWGDDCPPLSFRFQRWWLKKNLTRCEVSLNGFWPNQEEHCYSFENPCLTLADIEKGKSIVLKKAFDGNFVLTFVGRLEDEKGVDRIIEALKSIPLEKISKVNLIGDGPKRIIYEQQVSFLKDKVVFHGFLSKEAVHSILSESHFFLLPSVAEGFPKAIAEAACYGVLPIVSDVGSISHYVNDANGYLWFRKEETSYAKIIEKAISSTTKELKEKSFEVVNLGEKFTFMAYLEKLNTFIFK